MKGRMHSGTTDSVGRTWLVGSALAAPTAAQQQEKRDRLRDLMDSGDEVCSLFLHRLPWQMKQLAAVHRMSTDARRAIFSILLSSDDYLDAFEKIVKLKLKSKEDRDIVSVLLYCCGQVRRAHIPLSNSVGGGMEPFLWISRRKTLWVQCFVQILFQGIGFPNLV